MEHMDIIIRHNMEPTDIIIRHNVIMDIIIRHNEIMDIIVRHNMDIIITHNNMGHMATHTLHKPLIYTMYPTHQRALYKHQVEAIFT